MTAMLVSVAELSNIVSVLAVLLCFCAMVLFIMRNMMVFRLHGEDIIFGGSLHTSQPHIPQMKMMKVHIPFTFKLNEPPKNYRDDLHFTVSSQVTYSLQAFWGVSIRELHMLLWRPWNVLQSQMREETLLKDHYQEKGAILYKSTHSDEMFTLSVPHPSLLELGMPPRLCYPLIIFLIRNDDNNLHPDETVALINVVHIRDTVCTLPTSVLAQYLKQANGQLSCLKQLYMATGNPLNYEDQAPMAAAFVCTGDGAEQLCVVCQSFPLSRALLPCRHTCICASCFSKLDRCPMCRSPIRSYFCIRAEDYLSTEVNPPKSKSVQLYSWLQDLNDRLIDFLGFHR